MPIVIKCHECNILKWYNWYSIKFIMPGIKIFHLQDPLTKSSINNYSAYGYKMSWMQYIEVVQLVLTLVSIALNFTNFL